MEQNSADEEVKIPPFLKVEKEVTSDQYYSTYAMTLRLPKIEEENENFNKKII